MSGLGDETNGSFLVGLSARLCQGREVFLGIESQNSGKHDSTADVEIGPKLGGAPQERQVHSEGCDGERNNNRQCQ